MEGKAGTVIICPNCGAEFDAAEPVCPYCGAENVKASIREQLDYLEEIDKKEKALADLPEQKSRKVNRKIGKTALMAGIAILIILCTVALMGANSLRHSREKYDQSIEQLEQWYVANDYESIDKYLRENELYSASYDKYQKLADAYRAISQGEEYLKEDQSYIRDSGTSADEKSLVDLIQYGIRNEFQGLSMLAEMEAKGFVYGEEDGVKYLRQKATEVLQEYCGLTEEEIAEGTSRYENYDTPYREEAKRMIERIRG